MHSKKTPRKYVFSLSGSGRLRNENFRLKKEVVNLEVTGSLLEDLSVTTQGFG